MPPCLHASMPPCLHASSIAQKKQGFTLSELLISLAVLGLISALTLPSIVNSVSQSQQKAKMKETIQVLQDVMYTGYMNGEIQSVGVGCCDHWAVLDDPNSAFVQYFTRKFTGATHCPKGVTTPPCNGFYKPNSWFTTGMPEALNSSARWVLPNGVGLFVVHPWFVSWNIDGDMSKTTQTFQLTLGCNMSNVPVTLNNAPFPAKPGQCGPWDANNYTTFSNLYK